MVFLPGAGEVFFLIVESLFLFFVIISGLVLLGGFYIRSPGILFLACACFLLLGAILMSGEEIQRDVPIGFSILERTSTQTDVNAMYQKVNVSNDRLLSILQYVFFGGGAATLILGFAMLLKNRRLSLEE